ncbi:MAG TPA: condensation domain-containing protein, partial [Thermoanaerobaculia bacterium]|nr:condensation domain-containing protein [Thermoanaerobaculia bacterium]
MEPALAPFADEVRRVRLAAPQIPFFSNWTGELIRDEEATNPEYWVRHLRGTVRFGAAVGALWQEPNRILLEVGPGRALSTLARQHPERPPNGLVLSSLPAPRERQEGAGSELALLVTALGCLWMGGLAVHWAGFHGDGHRRRVQLPTYPFERRRHWIDAPSHQAAAPLARVAVEAAAPREVADWSPASAGTGHPRPALETAYVSPRTPEEQAVAAVWQSSLGIETVGVYDNFFELGGGSLLATRLAARLRETLGIDLPLRDLLEHPTVAALAAFVAARGLEAKEGAQPLPDLVPDLEHLSEPFPLTDVQQAYWVGRGDALALGNVSPHAYLELELEGFDLERFNRVLCRTIERQHMLRAVVLPDGRQRILPGVPPYRIAVVDLGGIPAGVEAGTLAVREHMSHQVLPSHRWPLFEVVACRLSGGRVRLHVSFDFLLGDAWSLEILLVELLRGYLDPGAVLPPLAISFRDYVLAEETLRASLLYERSLAYWRGRLATLPPGPELPLAKSLAALGAPRFVRRLMTLEAPVWERLKSRAARAGLTASGVLLAAFSDVLAAWSAHPRFTLSLTLFNRLPLHPQVNDLVGDFTSVVLLEADGAGREGFEVRAQRLQSRLWEDLDHRYVSGVAVLRELARVQSRPGSVAVPVVFTSLLGLTAGRRHEMAAGLSAREVYSISQTPQVLLDHQVEEVQGQLVTRWDAVEEAFSAGLLDAMLAAYQNLLRRLAEQEEAWHRTTRDLVGDDQLAARRAGLAAAIPMPETTLHALFEEQASRGPDRPAVVSPDRTLSYAELERWTRRLGHRLRARGAGPGRLVAVVLERGWRQ